MVLQHLAIGVMESQAVLKLVEASFSTYVNRVNKDCMNEKHGKNQW